MVLNPRAARHFAQVLMHQSKTDPVDARVLLEYVQRMDFSPGACQRPRSFSFGPSAVASPA